MADDRNIDEWAAEQRRQLAAAFADLARAARQLTEQASQQQRQEALRRERDAEQQAGRVGAAIREAAEMRRRSEAFLADQERQRQDEERRKRERELNEQARARAGDLADAQSRYGVALGQHYDIRSPYDSLGRAAMAEYAAFKREQDQLRREIAREADPEKRRLLELQKGIEAADYMAITSERLAGITRVIAGRRDHEGAIADQARAQEFRKESRELREERESMIRVRLQRETGAAPQPNDSGRDGNDRTAGARQANELGNGRPNDSGTIKDQTAAASAQRRQEGPPAPGAYENVRATSRDGDRRFEQGPQSASQSPSRPATPKADEVADKAADKDSNVEMTDRRAATLAQIRQRRQENATRDTQRAQDRSSGRPPGRSR